MKTNPGARSNRGQMLVSALMAMLVLLVIVPVIVFFVQMESRWSVKAKRRAAALQAVEASLDYTVNYLLQSVAGISWYNKNGSGGWQSPSFMIGANCVSQTNNPCSSAVNGYFTFMVSSGPAPGQLTLYVLGSDATKTEKRAIQAVYNEGGYPPAAIYATVIQSTGIYHWGPLIAKSKILIPQTNQSPPCYPQLYSAFGITVNSSKAGCYGGASVWNATSAPCSGGGGSGYPLWYADQCQPGPSFAPSGMPDVSIVNIGAVQYYATCYGGGGPGHCYGPGTLNQLSGDTAPETMYDTGSLAFQPLRYVWGSLYVTGNLDINTVSGGATYTIPDAFSPQGVPSTAAQNYGTVDTSATDEWPADAGGGPLSVVNSSFTFGSSTCKGACYASCDSGNCSRWGTKDLVNLRGFVYVGGNATFHANTVIHGILYVPFGTVSTDPGVTLKVYYDPAASQAAYLENNTLNRVSWQEISVPPTWPNL